MNEKQRREKHMEKFKIVLADQDIQYLLALELKLVKSFSDRIALETISGEGYLKKYLSASEEVDLLIISENLYEQEFGKYRIGNIFLLSENVIKTQLTDRICRFNKCSETETLLENVAHLITCMNERPIQKRYCPECGEMVNPNVAFCPKCGVKLLRSGGSESSGKEYEQKSRTAAGIVGFIGTLIAAMGMFLPLMKVWGIEISFFRGMTELSEEAGQLIFLLIVFIAVLEVILFLVEQNLVGNIIGGIMLLAFLCFIFSDGEVLDYLSTGFWVMGFGLIMMSISSIFTSKIL